MMAEIDTTICVRMNDTGSALIRMADAIDAVKDADGMTPEVIELREAFNELRRCASVRAS